MTADGEHVWTDGAYRLAISDVADDAWLAFVCAARFGAVGAQYRRHQFAREAAQFSAPLFCSLYRESAIVGCYLLDRRDLLRAGEPLNGLYRGVLFIDPAHRGRGLARTLVKHALSSAIAQMPHPVLTYGCVEQRNAAAQRVLQPLHMQRLGSIGSALRYRQRRGAALPSSYVSDGTSDAVAAVLQQTQAGDSLVDAAPGQWLSAQRGPAIAGCAFHLVSLNLDPANGVTGWMTERALDFFPPGRRRFNPRDFRYVAIRQPVAVGAGGAQLFRDLLAHLMHRYDTHFANVSLDEGDGSDSAAAVRQALGRGCIARRRILHVLGSLHGNSAYSGAPADAMQLGAPDL